MDKKQARKTGLLRRSQIPAAERKRRSALIFSQLKPLLDMYDVIGCYVSMRDEAETGDIIDYCLARGKTVAVPKVTGDTLRFYEIASADDLQPGCFGVREPRGGIPVEPDEIGLMIVPLTSFDSENRRTGYGKGYYDRILNDKQMKAGIAFAEQEAERIDDDPWDVKLDLIVRG